MKELAIFGAGAQGKLAAAILKKDDYIIKHFIDNSKNKQGQLIMGIPVISLEEYCENGYVEEIIIACSSAYQKEIVSQLKENNVNKYHLFRKERILLKERLISYSYPTENEDVILHHILKTIPDNNIHWIDVGSNDPTIGSVTQFFYERGGSGINIDMEKDLIEISKLIRKRDVNLWTAVGKEEGSIDFFSQGDYGGLSTGVTQFVEDERTKSQRVLLTTLKIICDEYVDFPISFLKIDVEGMEKDVLLGMDFVNYRPWILIIESTMPKTVIPSFEEWEYIVLEAGYHYVYSHGVNRYYVADEKKSLDDNFVPWEEMVSNYCLLHTDLLYPL